MPVGDASEECLGILALMTRHGVMVVDHETGEPAGNLAPFVRSGLLDPEKQLPIVELQSDVHECICLELAMMGHNIVLMLQAMGLGGLFFNPAYLAKLYGRDVLRIQKQPSVLESSFRIEKLADFSEDEEDLLLAGIVMMVLLERDRG
jgi:hypothetical protein